jgi:hypothetical protein
MPIRETAAHHLSSETHIGAAYPEIGIIENMLRRELCCSSALGCCLTDDWQLLRDITPVRCGRLRDAPRGCGWGNPTLRNNQGCEAPSSRASFKSSLST